METYAELCEAERLASARYVDADEAAERAADALPKSYKPSNPKYLAFLVADSACVRARRELEAARDARVRAEGSR